MLGEYDVDVTARDRDGLTPLHQASHMGYRELSQFLVKRCADVKVQNKNRLAPLYQASERCRAELVRFVVEHDAMGRCC